MHDTVEVPSVAVIVTLSVEPAPEAENVGVVSFVRLSVDDEPVSDDAAMSGTPGADGAVVSMFNERAELAAEEFPAGSVRVAVVDQVPSVRAGRSHPVAGRT